jgi:hypothetical protein
MFANSDSFNLSVIHPVFDTALPIPDFIRSLFPGTASIYAGYFGTGSLPTLGTTVIGAGPAPDKPLTMNTLGLNLHNGVTTQLGAHITSGENVTLGIELRSAVVSNSLKAKESSLIGKNTNIVGKNVNIGGQDIYMGGPTINIDAFSGSLRIGDDVLSAKKDFDIPHPTKDGWRLRHVCIEGPTADVYYRGKVSGNIIELPDYWKGLVDEETITVTLTPIGEYQQLFVESIEDNRIYIKNHLDTSTHCYYLVCAERKDVERNIPEYQGGYEDYPGNNSDYINYQMNRL